MPDQSEAERKIAYRSEMVRLSSLNSADIVARAIGITRDALEGLRPMQPVDLEGLRGRLHALPLNTGEQPWSLGKAIDTLTGSWSLDRKRCQLILAEWEL
ncbi:MAG TPA: hypothetical protein VJG66_00315 [Patescibacteria group bacterium]|nr:hypothetical protein [Patescibacteria group bacterium]